MKITIDTLKKSCPAVLEAWHKAEKPGGKDEHHIAYCTLDPNHDGDHEYGPWFDADQTHVPFTIRRRSTSAKATEDE